MGSAEPPRPPGAGCSSCAMADRERHKTSGKSLMGGSITHDGSAGLRFAEQFLEGYRQTRQQIRGDCGGATVEPNRILGIDLDFTLLQGNQPNLQSSGAQIA